MERKLQPRLVSVLTVLASAKGEVVSRQELIETIWSDYYTGDLALNQSISKLRRALGHTAGTGEIIETIVKAGYRLLLPVYTQKPAPGIVAPLLPAWAYRLALIAPFIGLFLYFIVLKKESPEPVIVMDDPTGLISSDLQAKIQKLATNPQNYDQVLQELKEVLPDSVFRIVRENQTLMIYGSSEAPLENPE